jgi:hypothetical protein
MMNAKYLSILKALAQYKFLTRKQFFRLGIEKFQSGLSKHLTPLVEADWIGLMDATTYGIGHVYYLKNKGAIWLEKEAGVDPKEIHLCISKPKLTSQTLYHRTGAIDCQIELFLSCQAKGVDVVFYDRDIEVVGKLSGKGSLVRKTRIPLPGSGSIEPDAIFMLDTPEGKKLYCLEFENEDYTKKSYIKVENHIRALNIKSPSAKYMHSKAHRTLFVYKNPSTMKAIMERISENISSIGSWFLFKTYDEVSTPWNSSNKPSSPPQSKDFITDWRSVNEGMKSLY